MTYPTGEPQHSGVLDVNSTLSAAGRPLNYINAQTEVSVENVFADGQMREVAAALSRWVDNARSASGRTSMFDRGMFTPPDNHYDEMRAARNAVKYDPIVAGVAEVTEAYAFQGLKWESEDPDEADAFNQLARDQNLDAVMRGMWKEEFTYGQVVTAKLWGWREYTVRGTTQNGNARKRKFRIWAPLQLRVLDSAKTVPVGFGPLAGEQLAWQASDGEINAYETALTGTLIDPLMASFFTGQYVPSYAEQAELEQLGVDPTRLLTMNPDWVFRHTVTKPDYERFADIRLKSCFSLLDMKRQLMQSDRATLIGAANYILLIRKGNDKAPALPEEMANLHENYNFIAKMPVIISDHRLDIDIIAPKTDLTLQGDKYDVLDSRLLARLLGTLSIAGHGQRNETQVTLSAAVARVMENRRHMLKRTVELEVARAIVEHPRNKGLFDTEPNLVFTPRNIALSMDQSYITGLLSLRTQREISRETILEYFGLDEATEALRMQMEADNFDDIFKTQIPFAASGVGNPDPPADPNGGGGGTGKKPTQPAPDAGTGKSKPATPNATPMAPGISGARGGRPRGGGTSAQSPQRQAKPRNGNGNPTRKA
jgi:hypothetical protein